MKAIVTIFNAELAGDGVLKNRIESYCGECKTLGDAFICYPKAGELFGLLNLLKENKIAYGIHFNASADIEAA